MFAAFAARREERDCADRGVDGVMRRERLQRATHGDIEIGQSRRIERDYERYGRSVSGVALSARCVSHPLFSWLKSISSRAYPRGY
jgi:hypothetical protein